MPFIEYLYIDKNRVNSYFDQIETPLKFDKMPEWKVEFGLPYIAKVAGNQSSFARPWTMEEKIRAIIKNLQENNHIEYERQNAKTERIKEFRFEVCSARKVFITPDDSKPSDFKGLNIWISPAQRSGPGMLFLIEDYQCNDTFVVSMPSGYSALLTLMGVFFYRFKNQHEINNYRKGNE
jgi:hypothetical protein